mgnify:CR=1 FL=1
MTEKWADYCVTAVRFNEDHTHIDRVKRHCDNGDTLGPEIEATRADVVGEIKKGTKYVTVVKNSAGKYDKGKDIFITIIEKHEYLKTVPNNTPVDNLDNLPEF